LVNLFGELHPYCIQLKILIMISDCGIKSIGKDMLSNKFDYSPLLTTFLIQTSLKYFNTVKHQVVQCIQSLEEDDKAYIYHPVNKSIPYTLGQSVADVVNLTPIIQRMDFCLKDAISVVNDHHDYNKKI